MHKYSNHELVVGNVLYFCNITDTVSIGLLSVAVLLRIPPLRDSLHALAIGKEVPM